MQNFLEQLRSLDPNDPSRWPLSFRLGSVCVVFILAVCLLGYFMAYKTLDPELTSVQAEEQNLLSELETKARKAANLKIYTEQLKQMQDTFGSMLRQLPDKTEVPSLLVDISQTGIGAGLQEKLFQPGTEAKKEFYAELPIRIRLTGSYHAIGNFVSGIAALPRIVTMHDFHIVPTAGKGSSSDQLQIDLTAKTYRYLDDEEQATIAAEQRKNKKNN
jgi:type IV pilus assembly protein PilO